MNRIVEYKFARTWDGEWAYLFKPRFSFFRSSLMNHTVTDKNKEILEKIYQEEKNKTVIERE